MILKNCLSGNKYMDSVGKLTNSYEKDIKDLEEKLKTANDTFSELAETVKVAMATYTERMDNHVMNDIMAQQTLHIETLFWAREIEIVSKQFEQYLKYNWFTKLFRKKKVRMELLLIRNQIWEEYTLKIKEANKAISGLAKAKKDEETK